MKPVWCMCPLLFAALVPLHAQDAPSDTAKLAYDVSTVKQHDPNDYTMSWGAPNGTYRVMGGSLANLIAGAWGVRPDQVSGEPAWADSDRWDVTGKVLDADEATLRKMTKEDRERMEQGLLAERFHVKVHLETRTAVVYNLVIAKGGLKMKEVPPPAPTGRLGEGKVPQGMMRMSGKGGASLMEAHAIGLEMLVGNLAVNMRQTVIDKTGILPDKRFDFELRWAPQMSAAATETDVPPLSVAIEEQLGLHLEAGHGPVQVVVVDHVEKPTAN